MATGYDKDAEKIETLNKENHEETDLEAEWL